MSRSTRRGVCWRGHSGVYKRDLEQWYFRITTYADQLLAGLEAIDWPENIKALQRNWIDRSEGVEFALAVAGGIESIRVYTTRPDTVCGITFVALAPEHPLLDAITTSGQRAAVEACRQRAARRSDVDRQRADLAGDGVWTGAYAVNPLLGGSAAAERADPDARVLGCVADYVLSVHGGGAIMGVPAYDVRDFAFACHLGLPLKVVVAPARPAG